MEAEMGHGRWRERVFKMKGKIDNGKDKCPEGRRGHWWDLRWRSTFMYSKRTVSSLIQCTHAGIAGLGIGGKLKGAYYWSFTRNGSVEEWRLELLTNDSGRFMSQEKDVEQVLRLSVVEEWASNWWQCSPSSQGRQCRVGFESWVDMSGNVGMKSTFSNCFTALRHYVKRGNCSQFNFESVVFRKLHFNSRHF